MFVAGGAAGICSTIVTNPFEVLRTRMAGDRNASGCEHKTLRCHVRALINEGLSRGASAGLLSNIVASVPANGIYLTSYSWMKQRFDRGGVHGAVSPAACAFGAVCVTNITLGPLFLIRSQCQMDSNSTMKTVARRVFRSHGIAGFWRGTATNIAGRTVEEGLFWSIFELLKYQSDEGTMKSSNGVLRNFAAITMLSGASKLIGTAVSYPYNVVMIHLRTVNKATGLHDHTKVVPTVMHIYRADGVAGFYKGLAPQILRSVISKATQIYVFELVLAMIR
jgi:solute carrier family 25 protein 33/36